MPISGGLLKKFKKKKKSGLSAPKVEDINVQRAIEKIYEDLNKLKDATNISSGTDTEEHEGKPGDIRVIKTNDKTYNLEVKGEEGWVTGTFAGEPIPYISVGSRKKYEPATIGDDGAPEEPPPSLTESDVSGIIGGFNFITSSSLEPDYDTGWFVIDRQNDNERTFDVQSVGIVDVPRHWAGWMKTSTPTSSGTDDGIHIYPWKFFRNDKDWSGVDWRLNEQYSELHVHTNIHDEAFWQYFNTPNGVGHKWYNVIECRLMIWK